ncbi:MAG TPA: hypothetical protein VG247_04255 [Pseudonocardiaceae bacterium]|jgi:hypothetical protein|nr:hypothetical protein [Pseudonocardiaceae bacterium]
MSGGFQVQEDAIRTAIGQLTALLNEAQTNGRHLDVLQHLVQPGAARETADFQRKVTSSSADLVHQHAAFVGSIQDQIHKLTTTLQRYQAGEDAAGYGFGN